MITGRPIGAAGRRKDETLYACKFGKFSEPHRSKMVHLVRKLGIQIAQWVVGQCGEMDHGIETVKVCAFHVTKIRTDFRNRQTGRSEVAARKQVSVESYDLVPRCKQNGPRNGPDVTFVPRQKYPHTTPEEVHSLAITKSTEPHPILRCIVILQVPQFLTIGQQCTRVLQH